MNGEMHISGLLIKQKDQKSKVCEGGLCLCSYTLKNLELLPFSSSHVFIVIKIIFKTSVSKVIINGTGQLAVIHAVINIIYLFVRSLDTLVSLDVYI